MIKKSILSLMMIIIILVTNILPCSAQDVNSNVSYEKEDATLLQSMGNSSYYLINDKIMKVVVEQPKIELVNNNPGINTSESEINIKLYETKKLSNHEINNYLAASSLTKSDEAMNPSGNIKAKLSVTYSWTTVNSNSLLRLISATSSYNVIVANGVVPQTSTLYWRVEGAIYKNNTYYKNSSLTDTTSYSKPTFSGVTLMPSIYKVDPISAGVVYTLKCSRSVNIPVSLSFHN